MRWIIAIIGCLAGVTLVGCDGKDNSNAAKDAGAAKVAEHHVHAAPHGGTLVEMAEHDLVMEVLLDADSGQLTAWLLNDELDGPVRVTQAEMEILVQIPATPKRGESVFPVNLAAVANPLTGETVGDTSQFSVTSNDLTGAVKFKGVISTIRAGSREYSDVTFEYPGRTTMEHDAD